jgi:8-oxo-dGTP diphosphatase
MSETPSGRALPYRIAVLCYLFDEAGRVLLLHRLREPNRGLLSPIGGKLHMDEGESPAACALREIEEEVELKLTLADLHLTGMVSEAGFEGTTHWLMFMYEVTRAVRVERMEFSEGRLEWHAPQALGELNIPVTDRQVLWPLFWANRGKFFTAHIDCEQGALRWRLEQGLPPA